MKSFKEFLEEKNWFAEGYPGTKENPPDNAAWVSPETKTNLPPGNLQGNKALPIPKKKLRLPVAKGRNLLPPHLRNDPDVIASTKRGADRIN